MVASSFSFVFLRREFFYDAILNFSFLIFMNAVFLLIGNTTGVSAQFGDVDIFYFLKTTVPLLCQSCGMTIHVALERL